MNKLFKIGESCQGGVLEAQINGNRITVIAREWQYGKYKRGQVTANNSPEFDRITVYANQPNSRQRLFMWLTEKTTSFYADQVLDFLSANSELKATFW